MSFLKSMTFQKPGRGPEEGRLPPSPLSRRTALVALAGAGIGGFFLASGAAAPARGPDIYLPAGSRLAAQGVDVVALVREGRPVAGLAAHSMSWRGAEWRFADAGALAAFAADPERYAPAYGGHCAWAAAQGYRAAGDPRHFRVVNGRLFLNYNAAVHRSWEADRARFIAAADRNWPRI